MFGDTDDDKDTMLCITTSDIEIPAICPDINIPLVLQVASVPISVLFLTYSLQRLIVEADNPLA